MKEQSWWGYFRLAEKRHNIFGLEGWIRGHIRKCFWLRWHNQRGRLNALRRLGPRGRLLKVAQSSKGAWPLSNSPSLNTALRNTRLRKHGFLMPSDLAATVSSRLLRSITGCGKPHVRPVVWEGAGAKSPAFDPIGKRIARLIL